MCTDDAGRSDERWIHDLIHCMGFLNVEVDMYIHVHPRPGQIAVMPWKDPGRGQI